MFSNNDKAVEMGSQNPELGTQHTLMSTNAIRSSRPKYGPAFRSLSTFPAHTLHSIGCSSSEALTRPMQIIATDRIVSREMSNGKADMEGPERLGDGEADAESL